MLDEKSPGIRGFVAFGPGTVGPERLSNPGFGLSFASWCGCRRMADPWPKKCWPPSMTHLEWAPLRREPGRRQNPADIPFIEAGFTGNRPYVVRFASADPVSPRIRPRDRF